MENLLNAAIEEQHLVQFIYEGRPLTIEPHLLRMDAKMGGMLLGKQVKPWVPTPGSWRGFHLGNILELVICDERFEKSKTSA